MTYTEPSRGNGKEAGSLGPLAETEIQKNRLDMPKSYEERKSPWTNPFVFREEEKKKPGDETTWIVREDYLSIGNAIYTALNQVTMPTPSDVYIKILRKHFVTPILEALNDILPYAQSPSAAVYIDKILHTIREMEKRSVKDPFLEILLAFYDSLNEKGLWATYTAEQFFMARGIIDEFFKEQPLRSDAFEKAIIRLEKAGFDTTPFAVDFEEEEE